MLGFLPQVREKMNVIPDELLTCSLLVLGVALIGIAIFVERKEIKVAALAYIVIP